MATENLDSMIIRSSPNKSEIMSLGLSRYFKGDCVMLSEETALSKNWQHTINWLSDYFNKFYSDEDRKNKTLKTTDVSNDLWNLVKTCQNLRLVLFLKKGYALKQLSKIDKNTRIIIYTDNTKLFKLTKFYENIITFKIKKLPKKIEHKFIYENIKKNLKTVFGKEKKILVMYTAFARKNSRANSFSFLLKDDFFSWN